MPSGRMIAWMVGLALATVIGLEKYRERSGSMPGARR